MFPTKTLPVATWQPLCPRDLTAPEMLALAEEFTKAMERFAAGDFAAAADIFEAINARQADGPSTFYANICRRYAQQPPKDFDGTIRLESK
jgi:hypothetical protein